jgi:hypothetical protein
MGRSEFPSESLNTNCPRPEGTPVNPVLSADDSRAGPEHPHATHEIMRIPQRSRVIPVFISSGIGCASTRDSGTLPELAMLLGSPRVISGAGSLALRKKEIRYPAAPQAPGTDPVPGSGCLSLITFAPSPRHLLPAGSKPGMMTLMLPGPRCDRCGSCWVSSCGIPVWVCCNCGSIFLFRAILPSQMRLTDSGAGCEEQPFIPGRRVFDP